MALIRLFHRTSEQAATKIRSEGFRDTVCRNFPAGVFLSNYPLDRNEGAKGEVLFEVLLEESPHNMFYKYEIIEAGKPYREFILPASILNDHARCSFRRLDGDDEEVAENSEGYWNEYPPGEPHRTLAEQESEYIELDETESMDRE